MVKLTMNVEKVVFEYNNLLNIQHVTIGKSEKMRYFHFI